MAMGESETGNLIGSDKVDGTAVYGADRKQNRFGRTGDDRQDERQGRLRRYWLRRVPGLGDDHYPLPWQSLKYDTRLGGYVTGVTENQLRGAPKYGNHSDWNWGDTTRTRALDDYYGVAIP